MNFPPGYEKRFEEIFGVGFSQGKLGLSISFDTVEEAQRGLKKINLMAKQLRDVKKDANADMKAIRSKYQAAASGTSANLTQVIFGKKAAGRDRAQQKERLRKQKEAELVPYENVASTVDKALLALEKAKLEIDEKMSQLPKQ